MIHCSKFTAFPLSFSSRKGQYLRFNSGNPATGYAANNPSAASNSSGQYPPSSAVYSNTLQGYSAGTYGPSHHTTPTMSSPYTSSPSPGAAGNGGHFSPYAKGVAPPPLKKYTLQPPPKKLPLHKHMELGSSPKFLLVLPVLSGPIFIANIALIRKLVTDLPPSHVSYHVPSQDTPISSPSAQIKTKISSLNPMSAMDLSIGPSSLYVRATVYS